MAKIYSTAATARRGANRAVARLAAAYAQHVIGVETVAAGDPPMNGHLAVVAFDCAASDLSDDAKAALADFDVQFSEAAPADDATDDTTTDATQDGAQDAETDGTQDQDADAETDAETPPQDVPADPLPVTPAPRKSGYINETSTVVGPTKLVWAIASSMPGATRKEVIAECRRRGIAYGTARTQYQKWREAGGVAEAPTPPVVNGDAAE